MKRRRLRCKTKRQREEGELECEEDRAHKYQQLEADEEEVMENMVNFIDSFALSVERKVHNQYWDEMSGKELNPTGVEKARLEELGELAKHGVYVKALWPSAGRKPVKPQLAQGGLT